MSAQRPQAQTPNLGQAKMAFNRSNRQTSRPLERSSILWPQAVNTSGSRLWAFDTAPAINPAQAGQQQQRPEEVSDRYNVLSSLQLDDDEPSPRTSGQSRRLPPGLPLGEPSQRSHSRPQQLPFAPSPSGETLQLQRAYRERLDRQAAEQQQQQASAQRLPPPPFTTTTASAPAASYQGGPIPSNILPSYPPERYGRDNHFAQYGWYQAFQRPYLYQNAQHPQYRVYCCFQCNWYTRQMWNLRNHVCATHMSIIREGRLCENCGMLFLLPQQLWDHKRVHDDEDVLGPSYARRHGGGRRGMRGGDGADEESTEDGDTEME